MAKYLIVTKDGILSESEITFECADEKLNSGSQSIAACRFLHGKVFIVDQMGSHYSSSARLSGTVWLS